MTRFQIEQHIAIWRHRIAEALDLIEEAESNISKLEQVLEADLLAELGGE